jgi:glycerophosphoryl diester phosphodiesterase
MQPFEGEGPAVVGHRGAPRVAPENTPAAFAAAAEAGAAWVELDARRAADGTVVVHHDPVTADGLAIVSRSAAELAQLGVWELGAILDGLPPGLGVDVECKNFPGHPDYDEDDALAHQVAALLAARAGVRPFMTSSFNPVTVAVLAQVLPAVPAGQLYVEGLATEAAIGIAAQQGARVLCAPVSARDLDATAIAAAHEAGLAVMVWTVDDPDRATVLAEDGADALCTNDPAGMVARLARRLT